MVSHSNGTLGCKFELFRSESVIWEKFDDHYLFFFSLKIKCYTPSPLKKCKASTLPGASAPVHQPPYWFGGYGASGMWFHESMFFFRVELQLGASLNLSVPGEQEKISRKILNPWTLKGSDDWWVVELCCAGVALVWMTKYWEKTSNIFQILQEKVKYSLKSQKNCLNLNDAWRCLEVKKKMILYCSGGFNLFFTRILNFPLVYPIRKWSNSINFV